MPRMSDIKAPSRWLLPAAVLLLLAVAIYFWPRGRPAPAPAVEADAATRTKNEDHRVGKAAPPPPGALAAAFPVAADSTVAIPPRFQLPGVAGAQSGSSFREWIAKYPPDQQAKITAFGKKHFGVYSVNSPRQVAWMAANGYPMPEDVIAADSLSDTQLRELAERGNDKAGFLLRERNIDTIVAKLAYYRAQGKTDTDFWSGDPTARQLSDDDSTTTRLLQQSRSPFKGYMQALDALRRDEQLGKDAAIIAGLAWAGSLGDFRATQFVMAYAADDPVRQAMATMAAAMDINALNDRAQMQNTGCENPGVPPGLYIPDGFAPVE